MLGFGIDLAGYTTGKTSLAVVKIEDRSVNATLLRGSALSKKRKSGAPLKEIIAEEVSVLRRCLAIGHVAVDVPIDLQGLPNPENPQTIWALTRRPIDYALTAMPPFADRIGAPVARFAAIMREGNFHRLLGKRLFEAYPSQTWIRLGIKPGKYKGNAARRARISLCKTLKIEPCVDNDDDIDAIICALTAAATSDQVCEPGDFKGLQGPVPKGFRILKIIPFDVMAATTEEFETWMNDRKSLSER